MVDPTDEVRERRVRLIDNRSARRRVARDEHVGLKASPDRWHRGRAAARIGHTGGVDPLGELRLDGIDMANDARNRSVLSPQSLKPPFDRGPRDVRTGTVLPGIADEPWEVSSTLVDQLIEISLQLAALAGRQLDRDRPVGLAEVFQVAPIRGCGARRRGRP